VYPYWYQLLRFIGAVEISKFPRWRNKKESSLKNRIVLHFVFSNLFSPLVTSLLELMRWYCPIFVVGEGGEGAAETITPFTLTRHV